MNKVGFIRSAREMAVEIAGRRAIQNLPGRLKDKGYLLRNVTSGPRDILNACLLPSSPSAILVNNILSYQAARSLYENIHKLDEQQLCIGYYEDAKVSKPVEEIIQRAAEIAEEDSFSYGIEVYLLIAYSELMRKKDPFLREYKITPEKIRRTLEFLRQLKG